VREQAAAVLRDLIAREPQSQGSPSQ
jgi:hypothetical protein